jgi:adenylate cyclase class 2
MKKTETEIKLYLADAASGAALLAGAGFRVVKPRVHEQNVLWDTPDERLRAAGQLARIRTAGGQCLVTFKGPRQPDRHRSRPEAESEMSSPEALEAIFEALGLAPRFRYEKFRTEFARPAEPGHVTLDETPIGCFLELEGEPAWIDAVARELGFAEERYITKSYGTLFLEHAAAHQVNPREMTFAALGGQPKLP